MGRRHPQAPEGPAPQAAQAHTLTPGSTRLEPHGPRPKHQGPLPLTTRENPDLRAWTASDPLGLGSELGRLGCLRNGPTAGDKNTHTSWLTLKARGQVGTVGSGHGGVLRDHLPARLQRPISGSEMPTGLGIPAPQRWAPSAAHLVAHRPRVNPPMKTNQTQKQVRLVLGSKQNSVSLCGWLAQMRSHSHPDRSQCPGAMRITCSHRHRRGRGGTTTRSGRPAPRHLLRAAQPRCRSQGCSSRRAGAPRARSPVCTEALPPGPVLAPEKHGPWISAKGSFTCT